VTASKVLLVFLLVSGRASGIFARDTAMALADVAIKNCGLRLRWRSGAKSGGSKTTLAAGQAPDRLAREAKLGRRLAAGNTSQRWLRN
jgi:hypothetical protein